MVCYSAIKSNGLWKHNNFNESQRHYAELNKGTLKVAFDSIYITVSKKKKTEQNYGGCQGLGASPTLKSYHEGIFWSGRTILHPDCGGGYMNLYLC